MLYKKLYKLNTDGSTQVWEMHYDAESRWTVSGKLDGKMTVGKPTAVTPKQKRTMAEQVASECESKVNKKRDKRYVESIDDIAGAEDALPGYSVMLAHTFTDHGAKILYPCAAQPKLDGVRCPATKDGLFSRGRKQFTACAHIAEELKPLFAADPALRLDAELYTHEYKDDFEMIVRAIKKTAERATAEDLELQRKMEYHVYDMPRCATLDEIVTFGIRSTYLQKLVKGMKHVKFVETVILNDIDDLIEYKEKWTAEGYEGIMLRNLHSPYEGKRSFHLQKFKDFIDAEWTIVGVKEGEGALAGHAGSFTFPKDRDDTQGMLDGAIAMTDENSFDAKLIGPIPRLKDLFENQDKFMGKEATVRYQKFTAYGTPKFPTCRGIRDYE
jgi:DNA ligase-1